MIQEDIFVKTIIQNWQTQLTAANKTLTQLSDAQLMRPIAPKRNRGIYLLGHLTAVHDLMLPLLRFEDALFPELKPIFLDSPDSETVEMPPVHQLREQWTTVNERLSQHMEKLSAPEWFTRHANITEADFVHEPQRNRLSVLLSRTSHLSYHRGQLILLIEKG